MGFLGRVRRFLGNLVPAFLAGGFFLLAAGRLGHDPSAGRLGLLIAGGLYGVGVVGLIRLFPVAPWAYFVVGFLAGPVPAALLVRGRMGGTGSPFNLGEVTVTRCVVRLETGETGSAYSLGRNKEKALQSAVIDALWQRAEAKEHIETSVIAPLAAAQSDNRETVREETEATKVNFFTMVRGDN